MHITNTNLCSMHMLELVCSFCLRMKLISFYKIVARAFILTGISDHLGTSTCSSKKNVTSEESAIESVSDV